jgi:hypothetical protein
MPSATALRLQIEHALERRFPAALTPTPRTIRDCAATGIPAVDKLLDGGFPVGAISEITGPASSGRTSLALSFLAQRSQEERVCAWVDADDTFDPESAAAGGMDLQKLLWIRCRTTSGPANTNSLAHLEQALRATDLLLQAGGFGALVLDLAAAPPENGYRIPLTTWFRFRQAADRTRCSLLVLARSPLAQSSAAVVLECAPACSATRSQTVLTGYSYQLRSGRQRFAPTISGERKPPASTWAASASWEREKRA